MSVSHSCYSIYIYITYHLVLIKIMVIKYLGNISWFYPVVLWLSWQLLQQWPQTPEISAQMSWRFSFYCHLAFCYFIILEHCVCLCKNFSCRQGNHTSDTPIGGTSNINFYQRSVVLCNRCNPCVKWSQLALEGKYNSNRLFLT